jgi:hypothetical protein
MTSEDMDKQLSEEIQAMKNPVFESILGQIVPFEDFELKESDFVDMNTNSEQEELALNLGLNSELDI